MAYTNETVHYGFPLPLAADLTVPMDYNESLEAADTALFEAQTNAAGAVGTAGNALTVANEAKTEAQSATATANSATATANAAATAANQAVADVAEAKDDALDMICAVVEETATAQYKHEPTKDGLNYYFRYNDILYKTTAVINVGETIVPNTNCSATNVATELGLNLYMKNISETATAFGTLQASAAVANMIILPLPNASEYTVTISEISVRGAGVYSGTFEVTKSANEIVIVFDTPTISNFGQYTITYTATV